MEKAPITHSRLAASPIAVPPLARDQALRFLPDENARLIRHIEAAGVNILLYGGNANFYHIHPSEYAGVLRQLAETASPTTLLVPSAGPAFGVMMDQAHILREFEFPTAMVLPHTGFQTPEGVAIGLRKFAEAFEGPIVVYIKAEGYLTPRLAAELVKDGVVSWIKYAIVRDDPSQDPFLSELVNLVDPIYIVSGIGEQPAIVHLRDFRCNGFTTGCGCVAPALSNAFLKAVQAGDFVEAERIRKIFEPLEDLRNAHGPARVLHEAVRFAGVANTGPHLPLLSALSSGEAAAVTEVAKALLTGV